MFFPSFNANGSRSDAQVIPAWAVEWLGRLLLALTALSLITMPLTQDIWTWDRFLHGGQDFELGTLMVLSVLGLVLVLSKHSKQCMELLLAAWRCLGLHGADRSRAGAMQGFASRHAVAQAATHPLPASHNTPLQI